jgi:hypothetical protein
MEVAFGVSSVAFSFAASAVLVFAAVFDLVSDFFLA